MGTVHVEDRDGVRRITLDRPPVNALGAAEYAALADALAVPAVGAVAPGVRVVLLRAKGSAFSAGQDLAELGALTPAASADHLERATGAIAAAARCPVPVVCALNGPAIGAGALLVAVSDHVVAAGDAWLSFPEARMGLELGASLLGFLPRAVAWSALATGDRLPVSRLHALGAIADLVATDSDEIVDGVAEGRVRELLTLPDRTLAWLRASADPDMRARAYEREVRDVVARLRSTP